MHIHILAIDTGMEAHAIRLAAEYWGADVTVTWVGNSRQIVDYFSAASMPDLLIISGHGDEHGLRLPELAPEIEDRYPYHGVITPQDFGGFLPSPLPVVLTTACLGGTPALAKVFLEHGAVAYVGSTAHPEGDAVLMYVFEFLYTYLRTNKNVASAHRRAGAHDDDRQHYHLYQTLPPASQHATP